MSGQDRIDPKSPQFFEKYQFTRNYQAPHPVYKDMMHFQGLEAEYVGRLEIDVEYYKRAYMDALATIERMQMREHYQLRDKIKELEMDKE